MKFEVGKSYDTTTGKRAHVVWVNKLSHECCAFGFVDGDPQWWKQNGGCGSGFHHIVSREPNDLGIQDCLHSLLVALQEPFKLEQGEFKGDYRAR